MRAAGWERRLNDLVAASRARPFEWGAHDCCMFALNIAEAINGVPVPRVDFWTNERQAGRLVKAFGVAGLADRWFGAGVDGWKPARRGDVVLIDATRGFLGQPALAVCVGPFVVCPGEFGLMSEMLARGLRTWRIG